MLTFCCWWLFAVVCEIVCYASFALICSFSWFRLYLDCLCFTLDFGNWLLPAYDCGFGVLLCCGSLRLRFGLGVELFVVDLANCLGYFVGG